MVIKKIINKIKESIKQKNYHYRDFVDKLMPSLKIGTIIYTQDYNEEKKDYDINMHIVVGFEGDKIIAVQCFNNPNKGDIKIGDGLWMNTFVSFDNINALDYKTPITISAINLSDKDLTRVKKGIYLNEKNNYEEKGIRKHFDINSINYHVGDIVTYSFQTYIIVNRNDDNTCTLIPINNHDTHFPYINFTESTIDYTNPIEVRIDNLYYLNSLSDSQKTVIKNNFDIYKNNKETNKVKDKKIERGSLVFTSNDLYYVYGIDGNTANAFQVKKSNAKDAIIINSKKYKPFYDELKDIDIKNDKYDYIDTATEDEMDTIREDKRDYKMHHKHMERSTAKKITKSRKVYTSSKGKILCMRDDITSRYIVYDEKKNLYNVLALRELLSNGIRVDLQIPKRSLIVSNNITPIELNVLKRQLKKIGESALSEEIEKRVAKK